VIKMPRPRCLRWIGGVPNCSFFKPAGFPARTLEVIVLNLDEFEALKLADLKGLYQEEAAKQMNISRPTFTRLVASARKKSAQALAEGKALRIEGGPVDPRAFGPGPGRRGLPGHRRGRGWGRGRR
jgi:predicted DNA-binding protein (UPF0251 family)